MKKCKVNSCSIEKIYGKGYCQKHYYHIWKHGKILDYTVYEENEIIEKEDIAVIILKSVKGEEVGRTIIDLEDLEKVKKYKWFLGNNGYAISTKKKKAILLHRLIMEAKKGEIVDHINRKKLDNTRSNLRIADYYINARNITLSKNNISGYTGVSWNNQKNKWQAKMYRKGKQMHLGFFEDKEEAIKARKEAEKREII